MQLTCPPCVTLGLTHNHITWPCVLLLTCSACWRRMDWWRSGTGSRPHGSSRLLIRRGRVKRREAVWLWMWSCANLWFHDAGVRGAGLARAVGVLGQDCAQFIRFTANVLNIWIIHVSDFKQKVLGLTPASCLSFLCISLAPSWFSGQRHAL